MELFGLPQSWGETNHAQLGILLDLTFPPAASFVRCGVYVVCMCVVLLYFSMYTPTHFFLTCALHYAMHDCTYN